MYIVLMTRWGDPESHSYVLGCWKTLRTAKKNGIEEYKYRGNKYEPMIVETNYNGFVNKKHLFNYRRNNF